MFVNQRGVARGERRGKASSKLVNTRGGVQDK
jgi:hypothetical protein